MLILFKFIIGTVFGSFLTLTSLRGSRHESIVSPPSHCDHCHHRLRPWDLIPIVSFVCLGGKCRYCRRPIGFLTLIGESLGGIILISNPLSTNGLLEAGFELTLLLLAECDHQRYTVPVSGLLTLLSLTLIQTLALTKPRFKSMILIVTAYLVVLILNRRFHFIGNGDVDLGFLFLLKVGPQTTVLIILISSGLAILKYPIHHDRRVIPYVPYLGLAYFFVQQI